MLRSLPVLTMPSSTWSAALITSEIGSPSPQTSRKMSEIALVGDRFRSLMSAHMIHTRIHAAAVLFETMSSEEAEDEGVVM